MNFETFLTMFLSLLVQMAGLLTAFCESVKKRLDKASDTVKAAPVPGPVQGMAAPSVVVPVLAPPQAQGGHAPTMASGSLETVYIPRLGDGGRVTPVAHALSGSTCVDAAGDVYTVIGALDGDSKGRLVCKKGKRACLRHVSDLTVVQQPVTPAPKVTPAPAPKVTPAPAKVAFEPPARTPGQTRTEKLANTLYDSLVASGVPRDVAFIRARAMAIQVADEQTASAQASRPATIVPSEATKATLRSIVTTPVAGLDIPSGASKVVFVNADGSPYLRKDGTPHSISATGPKAPMLRDGTHYMCRKISSGEVLARYE